MSPSTECEVLPMSPGERPSHLDVERVRADFPILSQLVHGKPLAYLDNAATTQKPRAVVDAITRFYQETCSNVHRGVHELSQQSTKDYERARTRVRDFLHARGTREIIFTRGATESINLVASTFGRARVGAGDEIVVTTMEHHSNIVPWQMLCQEKGARLRVAPIDDHGQVILEEYERLLNDRTRLVAMVHVSNALGTVNPVQQMVAMARARGIPSLVDGGAGGSPHAGRRAGARLRLLCPLGPQVVRTHGHRGAVRQGSPAGEDVSLPGRGRHDPVRHVREDRLQPDPLQVRGRHPPYRGRHRPGCCHRLPGGPGHGGHRGARAGIDGVCHRIPWQPFLACASWARPGRRRERCPSCWRASTRTTWVPSSMPKGWPFGRGTTVPSRSWSVLASLPLRVPRLRSTTPGRMSIAWSQASPGSWRFSAR